MKIGITLEKERIQAAFRYHFERQLARSWNNNQIGLRWHRPLAPQLVINEFAVGASNVTLRIIISCARDPAGAELINSGSVNHHRLVSLGERIECNVKVPFVNDVTTG